MKRNENRGPRSFPISWYFIEEEGEEEEKDGAGGEEEGIEGKGEGRRSEEETALIFETKK